MAPFPWEITSEIIRPLCGQLARARHERCPKLEDLNSISIRISCFRFYLRGRIGKKRPIGPANMQRIAVISVGLRGANATENSGTYRDGYSRSGRFNVHPNIIGRDSAAIVNKCTEEIEILHRDFHAMARNVLNFTLNVANVLNRNFNFHL